MVNSLRPNKPNRGHSQKYRWIGAVALLTLTLGTAVSGTAATSSGMFHTKAINDQSSEIDSIYPAIRTADEGDDTTPEPEPSEEPSPEPEPSEEPAVPTVTAEACFRVEPSTGGVVDYYTHEDNDPTQPECSRDIVVPSSIDGITIKRVGLLKNKGITSIVLPSTLTSIGANALSGNELTSIEVPDSVTLIYTSAFANNKITYAKLPRNITTLDGSILNGNQLTTVEIPPKVQWIYGSAFANNQLESIQFPNGLQYIEANAFKNNQLRDVYLPDSIVETWRDAFIGNPVETVSYKTGIKLGFGTFPAGVEYTVRGK